MEYRTGTKVFSNWIIEKELGEGATGKVFEIQKTDYGITTRSALKVIRVPHSASDIRAALAEGMDEQSVSSYFKGFVDEIVKEIVIMTNLKSHPNIVSYEDHHVTEHEGALGWDILIRMELLTPLYEYQLSHPMKEKDVLRMGVELTDALSFCQKKGLMHRDIKPENIFVSETGQFKLGDFGVARTVEKTTGGLSRKGTEKYMAPEVYLGRPYGSSVDIYSLGLVLYSFLNQGRLPFYPLDKKQITFADRENALGRRMQGDILPPPVYASESAAKVILKACAYRSEDRYHSAAEMHEALKKILYGGQEQTEEPDVHNISEEPYELEPEEQTVGMMEELSAEPEEKTAGMVEMPETEPEEKTVGIVESEQKTVVDLLINMPLSVQNHEVYEWLEKRHYDVQREEETAQIRVGDSETSLWTGILECEKKRDRYIAAALRLTLEEAEESQRREQFDYLTSTVFSQYHLNSMVENPQGDVRYVYSDNDSLFIVEFIKGISLEVMHRAPLSVEPSSYREIGTILVHAPLQSRSDTEEWLKDNGFRYRKNREEIITINPDLDEFSLYFSSENRSVNIELFVWNTEEIYQYIKKQIQIFAGEGGIDIYSEHPDERCNENWWWVLDDRTLRLSYIKEDKLLLLSIQGKWSRSSLTESNVADKLQEQRDASDSEAGNKDDPVKSAVRKETVIGLIGVAGIIAIVITLCIFIGQKNHYTNPSYGTNSLDYSDENIEMTEEDIESVVDILLNCPKDTSGGLAENLVKTWLVENGYNIDEDLSDDSYIVVPIQEGGMNWIHIDPGTGYTFTFIEVPDAQEIYESIRDQIQEKSYIDYEPAEFDGYDEGCYFYDAGTSISLCVDKSTGEIYITAY